MSVGSGRRRRGLRDDEAVLWHEVIRSVRPLRAQPKLPPLHAPAAAPAPPASPAPSATPSAPRRQPPGPPPLAPLERQVKKRLARGSLLLDRRIDLHGMTQAEAHGALLRFLHAAQGGGAKLVLVITGKGSPANDRGVLRRQVPLWLRLPEFRACVVGFESAHIAHGGEGAIYVRIRRDKRMD